MVAFTHKREPGEPGLLTTFDSWDDLPSTNINGDFMGFGEF
jgi:hypothetical protein